MSGIRKATTRTDRASGRTVISKLETARTAARERKKEGSKHHEYNEPRHQWDGEIGRLFPALLRADELQPYLFRKYLCTACRRTNG